MKKMKNTKNKKDDSSRNVMDDLVAAIRSGAVFERTDGGDKNATALKRKETKKASNQYFFFFFFFKF